MLKINSLLFSILLIFYLTGCQNGINTPNEDDLINPDQLNFETVDNEIALMKDSGMPLDNAAGIFSIGWNEMFRPFDEGNAVRGMAFAVAFGDKDTDMKHFRKIGLDMGDVYINYAGNRIELSRKSHDRKGTAYSLFNRPFGQSDNLLEFIPNTEYSFEVTGSDEFAPITITLVSPAALMDITNHSNGDEINLASDLVINWEGGNADGKIAVRLMPRFEMRKGHNGDPRGPMHHRPMFDRIVCQVLNTNTGTFTFPAEQVQRMLNGIDADGIVVEVSQMNAGEVEHENGTIRTAMRNGSSVMLKVVQ